MMVIIGSVNKRLAWRGIAAYGMAAAWRQRQQHKRKTAADVTHQQQRVVGIIVGAGVKSISWRQHGIMARRNQTSISMARGSDDDIFCCRHRKQRVTEQRQLCSMKTMAV